MSVFGNYTYREDTLIRSTARALLKKFEDADGYRISIQMKSTGIPVRIGRLGMKDGAYDVYEVVINGSIYGVYPNVYAVAIALCGLQCKASGGYKGWMERIK